MLLMLSGSGSYCGSRSFVIRCCCRRHGSAEPELFIQPSWSSPASRLGRAAHGAAGSRRGARAAWGHRGILPACSQGPAGFDTGWQGLRGAEGPGERLQ